ncbi:MAG: COQ9 family protein [Alphaproteobacteria bacterium]|jgi:ubiquinone biosynthesis protein COQ9
MTVDLQKKKLEIMHQLLLIVPKHGWCNSAMEEASIELGYDKHYASLLFIGGINEAIDFYHSYIDEQMFSKLQTMDLTNYGVPKKIYEAIVARIEILGANKDVAAKTISFLSLPWNAPLSLNLGWRTMDLIWYEVCNDDSHDFNYYTKRGLLLSVYASTLLYWISDESHDFKCTKQFLENRLKNVASLGKMIQKAKRYI